MIIYYTETRLASRSSMLNGCSAWGNAATGSPASFSLEILSTLACSKTTHKTVRLHSSEERCWGRCNPPVSHAHIDALNVCVCVYGMQTCGVYECAHKVTSVGVAESNSQCMNEGRLRGEGAKANNSGKAGTNLRVLCSKARLIHIQSMLF